MKTQFSIQKPIFTEISIIYASCRVLIIEDHQGIISFENNWLFIEVTHCTKKFQKILFLISKISYAENLTSFHPLKSWVLLYYYQRFEKQEKNVISKYQKQIKNLILFAAKKLEHFFFNNRKIVCQKQFKNKFCYWIIEHDLKLFIREICYIIYNKTPR